MATGEDKLMETAVEESQSESQTSQVDRRLYLEVPSSLVGQTSLQPIVHLLPTRSGDESEVGTVHDQDSVGKGLEQKSPVPASDAERTQPSFEQLQAENIKLQDEVGQLKAQNRRLQHDLEERDQLELKSRLASTEKKLQHEPSMQEKNDELKGKVAILEKELEEFKKRLEDAETQLEIDSCANTAMQRLSLEETESKSPSKFISIRGPWPRMLPSKGEGSQERKSVQQPMRRRRTVSTGSRSQLQMESRGPGTVMDSPCKVSSQFEDKLWYWREEELAKYFGERREEPSEEDIREAKVKYGHFLFDFVSLGDYTAKAFHLQLSLHGLNTSKCVKGRCLSCGSEVKFVCNRCHRHHEKSCADCNSEDELMCTKYLHQNTSGPGKCKHCTGQDKKREQKKPFCHKCKVYVDTDHIEPACLKSVYYSKDNFEKEKAAIEDAIAKDKMNTEKYAHNAIARIEKEQELQLRMLNEGEVTPEVKETESRDAIDDVLQEAVRKMRKVVRVAIEKGGSNTLMKETTESVEEMAAQAIRRIEQIRDDDIKKKKQLQEKKKKWCNSLLCPWFLSNHSDMEKERHSQTHRALGQLSGALQHKKTKSLEFVNYQLCTSDGRNVYEKLLEWRRGLERLYAVVVEAEEAKLFDQGTAL